MIIADGITSIGNNAFRNCSGLTSVSIPNSVTSIGEWAFSYCSGLTSVSISESVTSIGSGAFSDCHSLTSIEVASDNPNYLSENGVLFNKDKTKLIQCPGGKNGAYTISNSVTTIEESAFSGCTSLTEVINFAATPQEIDANVFLDVNLSACTLRVPEGSLTAYRTADVWKDFGNIEETTTVGINGTALTGITVYGNENNVYIVNKNNVNLKSVEISDMQGRVVYEGNASASLAIPVNGANGIYIVRLVSEDGKTSSTKVQLK